MTELIWVNGKVSRLEGAMQSFEDRGSQFADGVYEVVRVYGGEAFTLVEHLERLMRSAGGIRLGVPWSVEEIAGAVRELVRESGLVEGMVYMQLTRGVSARNHVFPEKVVPTLYFFTRQLPGILPPGEAVGTKLVSVEDERWKRCWVKAIALLPNVLAKNAAIEAGADEAVFVENGVATECSTSNLFVVSNGVLITAPVGQKVLPGVTRGVLLELCGEMGISVIERCPTEYECRRGEEIFITSTTREISWVSHWNGEEIHEEAGPVTMRLHRGLQARVRESCVRGKAGVGLART